MRTFNFTKLLDGMDRDGEVTPNHPGQQNPSQKQIDTASVPVNKQGAQPKSNVVAELKEALKMDERLSAIEAQIASLSSVLTRVEALEQRIPSTIGDDMLTMKENLEKIENAIYALGKAHKNTRRK